jgi:serine/threonine-protein kinase
MESSWPIAEAAKAPPLAIKKGVELNQRYVISDLCGTGAFATVWRATDKQENRDVAIKRLTPKYHGSVGALLQEAENVKKLTGHKNIVQLYETFTEGGEGFLVMEFVEGGTLDDLLKQHVKNGTWIDQDDALDYVKQIIEGLIFAHSSGLYHRDIKPSNILISAVGTVKLADFGLAKAMTEDAKQHQVPDGLAWTGTPQYMSYEQARGEALNHQTDIMSVGIVAYLLITGRNPFNHPSGVLSVSELIKDQNYQCPKPLGWDGKALKPHIIDILLRLLQKDKSTRYQTLIEPLSILSRDDSVQCRKCTAANPKTNRFCGQCGSPLSPSLSADKTLSESPAQDLTPEQLNAFGFDLTKVNDWDGAIRSYREALAKDPKFAPAHANLGFALNRKAEYREAMEIAKQGLLAAKDDGIRHRLFDVLGFAKSSLNDAQGAIADFSSALDLRDNPRVFVHRAESRAAIGDIPGAYEDTVAALQIDSDYYPATKLQTRLERLL